MLVVLGFICAAVAGGLIRHVAHVLLSHRGIVLVNVLGSALAAAVMGWGIFGTGDNETVSLILVTAGAGALTTMSSVSLAAAEAILDSRWKDAARIWSLNIGVSLLCAGTAFALTAVVAGVV